jgi:hypothetical protein
MECHWVQQRLAVGDEMHVFGIRPDAGNKTIVFEPHLPAGWENINIEDLPVGANLISFSRTRKRNGVIYDIESKENGWSLILREKISPDTRYFLNGRPTNPSFSGIHMDGKKNRVLITSEN